MVDAVQNAVLQTAQPSSGTASISAINNFNQQLALGSAVATQASPFTYWGFGFTIGDVAKLGEKGLELLAAKLGIGTGAADFAQRILNFTSDAAKFLQNLGISDPSTFFKIELNFPFSLKGADWKTDTIMHLKFNAKALAALGTGAETKLLQTLAPGLAPQEVD